MRQTFAAMMAIGLMVVSTGTVQASLITNGDFSAPAINGSFVSHFDGSTGIVGWEVGGRGPVDHIGTFWNGISNTQGDQSVDIDFDTTLFQTFATTVNTTYELTFYYSHNYFSSSSSGSASVDGNSNLLDTGLLTHDIANSASNMQWVMYTQQFTADSTSTTLTFQGVLGNGNIGWAIDGVSVEAVTSQGAVPEPHTIAIWSLMGIGCVGAAGWRRRRKLQQKS